MTWGAESRRIFVDTNGFVALGLDVDEHHRDAVSIFGNFAKTRQFVVTTNFIVAETHAVMLRRDGRDSALRIIDRINRAVEHIERVTEADEERAVAILRQYDDKTFSYTDATSFAVMERLKLRDVFTFDRHFEQFGFSPLKPS
jgi:predicted nucleic acid-binding protein